MPDQHANDEHDFDDRAEDDQANRQIRHGNGKDLSGFS
jgi:hypothetical protein